MCSTRPRRRPPTSALPPNLNDDLDGDRGDGRVPQQQQEQTATARAAQDRAWRSRRRTLLLTSSLILSSELCERLAYYSLSFNLVVRLTSLGFAPGPASSAVAAWQGTAYLVGLLGAWLADAVIGRYWVIFGGSLLYQAGLAGVVAVTVLKGDAAALLGVLAICALGTGGIKSSVGSFGADQFDISPGSDPRNARGLARYFNFFYFSINVGPFLASTVVVGIQESYSWTVGYAIPAVAFALSFLLFLAGTRIYTRVPPKKAPFARVFKVFWRALWSRRKAVVPVDPRALCQSDDDAAADAADGEEVATERERRSGVKNAKVGVGSSSPSPPRSRSPSASDSVSHTNYATWLDRAAVKDDTEGGVGVEESKAAVVVAAANTKKRKKRPSASPPCTLSAVKDTKRCLAYFTVCFSLILFGMTYTQMTTVYVIQGNYGFDRRIGKKLEVPSASLNAFDTVAVLVLVPLYDSLIVPLVRRLRARKAAAAKERTVGGGVPWDGAPTHLERIGAGLATSVLAMLAGAAADAGRSRAERRGEGQPSIFWLAPQYALVGAAEVLASIGALDLAFTDAPDSMRSLLSAANSLSVAIGSFAASGVTAAVQRGGSEKGWLPDKEKGYPGRLVRYYLMLAGVSAVNFLFFVFVVARR